MAVNAPACRSCAACLDGCVYGAIFNPRLAWEEMGDAAARVHRGYYALEFSEDADLVEVAAVHVKTAELRRWRARRLYLAAGHVATARMIARSLGRVGETIRALDSQYFFFPFFSYDGVEEETRFTLAEAFLEVFDTRLSDRTLHFQVYGMNEIFRRTLDDMLPPLAPRSPFTRRFYVIQGYLPSAASGHLEIQLTAARPDGDDVTIRGRANPEAGRLARKSWGHLRRALLPFGLAPPAGLTVVPPGRSFHAGGSFPMGGDHPVYASDALGRPAGLNRVHIADSASFPSIASSTIAFTIMANADRIARGAAALEG